MADIQKIKINEIIYNLKDAEARAAIAALPSPMVFKGTVGEGGTVTELPVVSADNEGYTYKVITALTSPVAASVGDTVISNGSEWVVIPSGDEPVGTVTNIATGDGLTGGPITSSGTISHVASGVASGEYGDTSVVPVITVDAMGHITGVQEKDIIVSSVANINEAVGGVQKFWRGTLAQYEAIAEKEEDTLYVVTDETQGENTYVSLSLLNEIIAPEFDETTTYVAGELVLKMGALYKRNTDGSGAWNEADWTATTVSEAIKQMNVSSAETEAQIEEINAAIDEINAAIENLITINGTSLDIS